MAYPIYALVLAAVAVYYIATRIASSISAYRFKRAHGCKPEHKLPQTERFLGLHLFLFQRKAFFNKTLIPIARERFAANGPTFSSVVLGQKLYNTVDPENIKAILATNFADFGLGKRLDTFGSLLGKGIFTSDGTAWEHSRVKIPARCQ